MVGPTYEQPDMPPVDSYTETKLPQKTARASVKSGKAQRFALCKEISGEWWTLFQSKELNAMIEAGINNSPNLEAAKAALRQAQENMISFAGANMLPAANALGAGIRQRMSAESVGLPTPPAIFDLYNATVNVSYTLDAFGGARRGIEALCAQVEYQYFLLEGTYLALTANIVTAAITEASLRAQLQVTYDLININEKQLDIINKQFQLGGVALSDVLAQQTQLAQLKATLPSLEKNLSATRHALAALIGTFPSEQCLPDFYLTGFNLPKTLPISLPSELVRQRPDIRASEALFHQASANVGIATANMFPQITLSATYGGQSNHFGDLFKGMSNIWSFGGQLLQPVFQGGSLLAKRRASIAAYDQAAAQYRQTVIQAFQNVADTLRALETDARTLKAQVAAEAAAKISFELSQKQYNLGAVNYLVLLNAEQQYQLTRINRIKAEAARYSDTAALFQAMGGGWWNQKPICDPCGPKDSIE